MMVITTGSYIQNKQRTLCENVYCFLETTLFSEAKRCFNEGSLYKFRISLELKTVFVSDITELLERIPSWDMFSTN